MGTFKNRARKGKSREGVPTLWNVPSKHGSHSFLQLSHLHLCILWGHIVTPTLSWASRVWNVSPRVTQGVNTGTLFEPRSTYLCLDGSYSSAHQEVLFFKHISGVQSKESRCPRLVHLHEAPWIADIHFFTFLMFRVYWKHRHMCGLSALTHRQVASRWQRSWCHYRMRLRSFLPLTGMCISVSLWLVGWEGRQSWGITTGLRHIMNPGLRCHQTSDGTWQTHNSCTNEWKLWHLNYVE